MAKKQFLLIGLGTFGMNLAKELSEKGAEVLAIDKEKKKVEEASSFVVQAIEGDATDEHLLSSLGIKEFDAGIVTIGENFQSSVLLTLLLKEYGIKRVIVRCTDEIHAKIFAKIGADKIILPEKDMSKRLAEQLVSPSILEEIEISKNCDLIELPAPKEFIGKTLKQLNLRQEYKVNVVAIKKKIPVLQEDAETDFCEEMDVAPTPESEISEGDVLFILGRTEDIEKLKKQFA